MAQQEGVVDTQDDDNTVKWLRSSKLQDIISKCQDNGLTYDDFIEATEEDLRVLCEDAGIARKYVLRLKKALKQIPGSVIYQSSKPTTKVIYLGAEEQDAISKLHNAFDEVCQNLEQNKQNIQELEKQSKYGVSLIDSSMDKVIKLIETKRKSMIAEINKITSKKSKQLTEKATQLNEFKQFVNDEQGRIDKVTIDSSLSSKQKKEIILEISNECMNKSKLMHTTSESFNIAPIIIDIDKVNKCLNESCYIEFEKEEAKRVEPASQNYSFITAGNGCKVSSDKRTVKKVEQGASWNNTTFGASVSSTSHLRYVWKIKINRCVASHIQLGISANPAASKTLERRDSKSYFYWSSAGRKVSGHKRSDYGEPFEDNDEIWIELNMGKQTLTFYKNKKCQGIAFTDIPNGPNIAYNMVVSMFCVGSSVSLKCFDTHNV